MNREDFVRGLLRYIDNSPSPFHAVAEASAVLDKSGFVRLDEALAWDLSSQDKFYVTRGDSSLIAIVTGETAPHDGGLRIVAAHTDSPNLRLKPLPARKQSGYQQLAIEVYGSPLWSTWLDRDLSLAGRVWLDDGKGQPTAKLVRLERPILRIPNLAIHLNRAVNSEGLKLNAQQHLVPVIGLESDAIDIQALLLKAIVENAATSEQKLHGWDLALYDCQPSALGGATGELIFAPRLDDLACCYAGLSALLDGPRSPLTRVLILYDHEECGSGSVIGADSAFVRDVLQRMLAARANGGSDAFSRAMAKSACLSADMAHAVHPNYPDMHEPGHRPILGGGPVVKTNANQAYATDGEGRARLSVLAQSQGIPLQHYVTRSDLPCGGTVGPLIAAWLGVRTVDVGSPMLAMHSIREMAQGADIHQLAQLLKAFFADTGSHRVA